MYIQIYTHRTWGIPKQAYQSASTAITTMPVHGILFGCTWKSFLDSSFLLSCDWEHSAKTTREDWPVHFLWSQPVLQAVIWGVISRTCTSEKVHTTNGTSRSKSGKSTQSGLISNSSVPLRQKICYVFMYTNASLAVQQRS